MAIDLGSAYGKITIQTDDAIKSTERLGNSLSGSLGRIGGIAQGAFLGLGAAAVGGFAAAGAAAISMNASLETSTMQFTTLMGSADDAASHVKNLFAFAASTPYESQEIINASLKLQTFGGAALNTMENLTLVGDAAAAVNAPIEDVSFWIGRLYSNLQGGQPFGEAAMRLQELGIMTPQARQELEKMQESGAEGSEIFGVFQDQLGTFTGAMEMQAGTWSGLMSTIKDNLMMAAAEGLRPFFDLAKQGLTALAGWLSSPEIQQGIQNFAQGFATLINNIADFVANHVIPFVQQHGEQLKTIIVSIGTALGTLAIIGTVVGWITSLIGVVTGATAAFAAAGGGIAGIVAILGGPLTLIIAAVAGIVALFTAAWRNNWGDIQGKVEAVWAFLQPIFAAVMDWVGVQLKAAIEILRAYWVDYAWPAIQNIVAVVWPVLQTIFTAIKTFITDILIPTVQFLWRVWTQEVWPVIQTVTENVWTIVKEIFTEIGSWINDNIVPWVEFLKRVWVEIVWPAIQQSIENAWAIIKPIWEAIREWAAETLPPVIEALRGIFEGVMSGISAAIEPVKRVWDSFVDAVTGFWDWIKSHVFDFSISIPDLPDWAVPGRSINGVVKAGFDNTRGINSGAISNDSSRTVHIYGGVHAYIQQSRRGWLDDIQEMLS